ncbi:MAG: response regulator transcription factor [Defluviitaleaceae bacterium]|nr:response regulator transcription factor [Defluviitaleaceae bacterium]
MLKILICEDEENIVSFLATELKYEGLEADAAFDGDSALSLFAANKYDLVLLDIMLPGKNGLECLHEIRKTSAVPVIILTARKDVYDKVAFLNAGADDYVTKPFDTLELIARIKRNIERAVKKESSAGLYVNGGDYRALIDGKELGLTKTEFEMLRYLYDNINTVKTRDEILNAVFGNFYGESNVVDVNIKNIRAKIHRYTEREVISTVRGKGYVIRDDKK